jgi:deazaflavin-dependent oxidoreductase (nitroreductase family)
MKTTKSQPGLVRRLMRRFNGNAVKMFARANHPGPDVLLLTTIGRKSGLPRVTPVQFEEMEGKYYVGAGFGPQTDWLKNLQKTPRVGVQIRAENFDATAECITDPREVADLLAYRLKQHPVFVRVVLTMQGLPLMWRRADLERIAADLVFVRLTRLP